MLENIALKCQRVPEIEKKTIKGITVHRHEKYIRFPSVEKLVHEEEFHELIVFQSFAFYVKNDFSVLCLDLVIALYVY